MNMGGKNWYEDDLYNDRITKGTELIKLALKKSRQENLEEPIILGYSMGSLPALFLSTYYDLQTNLYSPVLAKSRLTEKILERANENDNLTINFNKKDPITNNIDYYKDKYLDIDFNEYKNNKYYNTHSLNQYI